MEHLALNTYLADEPTQQLFDASLLALAQEDELLSSLMDRCEGRDCRTDGIPALIVIEDFFAKEQPPRKAAPGDEGMGQLYSLWLTVLAAKYTTEDPGNRYPPVCPAMSALAEKFFRIAPYQDAREEKP